MKPEAKDTFIQLAAVHPATKVLSSDPRTLKYFPLRRTAKLFAIADVIMATFILVSRYFITTRIVTFPIFQMATAMFYLLISCFGIYQVFFESISSFPAFLISSTISMAINLIALIILGLQTFDMGLITDNCGDQEVCLPHVKPIALFGWILTAVSLTFLVANALMLVTYWQLNRRLLDEQEYGHQTFEGQQSSSFHLHRFQHQNYPVNFSRSSGNSSDSASMEPARKIRTPQPKRPAKDFFREPDEIVIIARSSKGKDSALSEGGGSENGEYKSFPISPLELPTSVTIA